MATKPVSPVMGTASYLVDVPPYRAAGQPKRKKKAVFVAHGMGQQIPFETLDQVAEGLRQIEIGPKRPKPISRSVKFADQWVPRVELELHPPDADPVDVHVYEGYWAPLTEGKVTLRDVVRFLIGAARNGIKNARGGRFKRWLFDRYEDYPIAIRTLFYLLIALATVGALIAMNSTIAIVAAGRAVLGEPARWLSDGLFADLTTTFNGVIVVMAIFGVSLALATGMRAAKLYRPIRTVWSWITIATFMSALSSIILGGVSLPLLFYGHVRGGAAPAERLWYRLFPASQVDAFNAAFDLWAWKLTILALFAGGVWWISNVMVGLIGDLIERSGRPRTLLIAAAFGLLVFLAIWLIVALAGATGSAGVASIRGGLAWVLLIVVSAYIRQVLVQFVGDVAAYIMPYKLDAFNALRKEIKACIYKVAHGIYAMRPEYDQVIIVGHSLGSVIVYDVLNQLILEDKAIGSTLDVVNRTPLLLTFGSPLDKTAFIFALQRNHTDEARESLAASVQPLIAHYDNRPTRWINVYSPWDIVSGHLGFYDLANAQDPKKVNNQVDPDATTLLAAHTEYWNTGFVMRCIYAAIAEEASLLPFYKPVGAMPSGEQRATTHKGA